MMSDTKQTDDEVAGTRHSGSKKLEACVHGFIRDIEALTISSRSGIAALRCRYVTSAFHDRVYASLGIVCPVEVRLAVIKRRAEYLAGRFLAQTLLYERGMATSIGSGNHRQPLWPAGWIGSIAHTDDAAISCIAPEAYAGILGIDVENWFSDDTAELVASNIVRRDEQALLSGPWSYTRALTLAFSAKESLFKALYPKVGCYFDFNYARLIDVNYQAGTFSLQIVRALSPEIAGGHIYRGCFQIWGARILTLISGDGGNLCYWW